MASGETGRLTPVSGLVAAFRLNRRATGSYPETFRGSQDRAFFGGRVAGHKLDMD